MTDYSKSSVEELKELVKAREIEGRSKLTKKDQLIAALNESDSETELKANLSPKGQDALEELGEDSEAVDLAELELDAQGPLTLQSPSERVMVGAQTEEQGEEQEELVGDLPEDYVGDILEDGTLVEEDRTRRGSGPDGEVLPEDVIDFPPPLPVVEEESPEPVESDRNIINTRVADEVYPDEGPSVAAPRLYDQRGQLYTDGLSGQADHNTSLAYRLDDLRNKENTDKSPQQEERRQIEKDRTGE